MKIVEEKIEDTRRVQLSIDGDDCEYALGNNVILLVREIGIIYKYSHKSRKWLLESINLDGWRKGKPQTAGWWIWGNAIQDYTKYAWLYLLVEGRTPCWSVE